jgi:hypothetical protein
MQVGPVLIRGINTDAVIAAIREENKEVSVLVRSSYVRISQPTRCILTRALVEKYLDHTFVLPGDLELIMPAFQGTLRISHDRAIWEHEVQFDEREKDQGNVFTDSP